MFTFPDEAGAAIDRQASEELREVADLGVERHDMPTADQKVVVGHGGSHFRCAHAEPICVGSPRYTMNTADFMVERWTSIRKEAVSTAQVPWREPMTTSTSADKGALLREVLARIGDKWSVIVICRLDGQPRRFNELRRLAEGITQRMLSATLRHLERDGLVRRTVYATVPPQVEYALTDRGRSLHTILYQLVDWTDDHLAGIQASRAAYDTGHATDPTPPAASIGNAR